MEWAVAIVTQHGGSGGGIMIGSRPRVLLITPYSPLRRHDHAADDLARPFAASLSRLVNLHVYSSDEDVFGEVLLDEQARATFHGASARKARGRFQRLTSYPYALRSEWQKANTHDVLEIVKRVEPDVVHCEYFQPAEAILALKNVKRTATLHDLSAPIFQHSIKTTRGLSRISSIVEYVKVRRVEKRFLDCLDHAFVFSERDAAALRGVGLSATRVPIGVGASGARWAPTRGMTLLFAAALWREPNQATARFIACEVFPLVRERLQGARLRIVGSRPPQELIRLAEAPGVEVCADVPDLDLELAAASVVVSPSMVPVGILLKSLKPLAMGCPVVLNSLSAAAFPGIRDGRDAIIRDRPEEMADAIVGLMSSHEAARAMGESGRTFVSERFSWESCAAMYEEKFGEVVSGEGSKRRK